MQQCKIKWKNKLLENLSDMTKGKLTEQDESCHRDWLKLLNTETLFSKIETYANTQNAVLATDKDVLILCDGERSGLVAKGQIGVVGSTFAKLTPYNQEIYSEYLYHYLNDKFIWIQNRRTGTGVPHIPKDLCHILNIKYPEDIKQQEKIAQILSTCDSVIEKTEETIEKYKQIKAGMMQDLFTRGLDENGKLRSKYEDAPELYKYSEELDRYIPKEWDVSQLSNIGEFKNGLNKEKKYFGHGTKFVNIIDAYKETLDICALEQVETNNNDNLIYSLKKGDLIFVRSSVKPEGVGYNTIFLGANEPIVYCGFMIRFRLFESNDINSEYLNYYFRTELFRKKLISKSTVSANTNINQESLNELFTILPSIKEQNKVVEIIKKANDKLHIDHQYLLKYKQIKQGLMKKLLTPPADAEIVEE